MVEGACERMMAATADDFMPLYTPARYAAAVWGFLFGRVLCCIYIYAHFCSIHFFRLSVQKATAARVLILSFILNVRFMVESYQCGTTWFTFMLFPL